MGKFSESAAKAADNVERIARALESMPQGGSFSGPGGGQGGGTSILPPTVFNTTVVVPQETRLSSGGPGGGGGSKGLGGQGSDIQSRAFAYFGLSSAGKSSAFVKQIVDEFLRILKNDSLTIRTSGGQ